MQCKATQTALLPSPPLHEEIRVCARGEGSKQQGLHEASHLQTHQPHQPPERQPSSPGATPGFCAVQPAFQSILFMAKVCLGSCLLC